MVHNKQLTTMLFFVCIAIRKLDWRHYLAVNSQWLAAIWPNWSLLSRGRPQPVAISLAATAHTQA